VTATPPSFLIVRLGSLGDVIHAIPAAAALRARHPDARIDWAVDPRYVEVLRLVTAVDRAVPLDTRGGASAVLRGLGGLRRARYDAVVDLQGLLKSAVLARLAGGQRTIGLPRSHLREPFARFFYGETPDPGTDTHVIHQNLSLMRALGVTDASIAFSLSVPETATGDAAVAAIGSDRFVALNPGAAWPNKRWPPERFGALAAALRDRLGLRSLVLWGPGEEELARRAVATSAGAAEPSPPTGLVDLFDVTRRARLVVSGDTGPLHIAAAVGTPVVALFGPTFTERNGPWAHDDVTVSRAATCDCHYERRCRRATPCIDDITIEEVLSAVESRMRAGDRG
jgi:lipopolysaccharide heptosyltransferase I